MISQSYRVYESEVCGPEAGFQVQVTSSLRLGVRRGLARFYQRPLGPRAALPTVTPPAAA